jgi:hypothetical protein
MAPLLDALAILLFVVLGRRTHDEGGLLAGTVRVAWPFLVGAAAGWAVLALARRPGALSLRGGLVVLAAVVVVGMTLRHLSGGGVQVSFVLVATAVLGGLLLGWRLVTGRRG